MVARIIQGDCLDVMREMEPASVDAIVTDPPYGLNFMARDWDHGVPGERYWIEALRVAKPGAHLLAFGGTRTFHRLTCAIEDAGWEIRDCLGWIYGSGFPKSLDVSKAIDKANGRRFEDRYALGRHIREMRESAGMSRAEVNAWFGYTDGAEHWERQDASGARVPTLADWAILKERLGLSDEFSELVERAEAEREKLASVNGSRLAVAPGQGADRGACSLDITAPATDAAREWQGWGTALKPAWEPIILARTPLAGTVAATVCEHGTGALNIDGCRVAYESDTDRGGAQALHDLRMKGIRLGALGKPGDGSALMAAVTGDTRDGTTRPQPTAGRWPANLIHDGSDEVLELFPMQSGGGQPKRRGGNTERNTFGDYAGGDATPGVGPSSGSAARFFYCAKASRAERGEGNVHPTVKPLALMRYLCRLVTPPGGRVLDPFAGSGSTLIAAVAEGFEAVGIEREAAYAEIARQRFGPLDQFAEATS